jgi:Rhodopirellula transposase DDE domain
MIETGAIRLRWEADGSKRDERGKRVFAASEARAAGWGGVAAVAEITGLARSRIIRGLKDLDEPALEPGRIRRAGGGRPRVTATDRTLLGELKRLVEPATMGDPMRPLTWVSKSREKLACELNASGHDVSPNTIGRLLVDDLEYSRQVNRKTLEGASHPDRNAQFEHINAQVIAAQSAAQPVISVDTKKKELIGNFKNGGTDYRPKGDPLNVNVHDFQDKELGKVVPHGIYDPTTNAGWVSVGITHDTAEFAVQSIRTWLERIGRPRYTGMRELMITADCGGSNSARSRLWKVELQKLADEIAMPIKVCHYPPGTSKWNKIEHRLFCHITQNWRAKPLVSRAAVVELIAATTTKTGLKVACALDERTYEKGIKITDAEMEALDIRGHTFHPEWNYTVHPRPKKL